MNDTLRTPTGDARADAVLDALNEQNLSIEPEIRQDKYCRMASAPLVFYRGTDHLFWADFANDERLNRFGNARTRTWLQGDLHAYNYGSYHDAKGHIVFDLNDFDECIFADYQYDIWRMVVSIVLVARQNDDLSDGQLEKVVDTFSQNYLDTLNTYRKHKKTNKIHYTKDNTYGKLNRFLRSVEQHYTRQYMLDKWAPKTKKGGRCFDVEGRSEKLAVVTDEERAMILDAMVAYRETLNSNLAKDNAHFEVKDVAQRLAAGTGSLGTQRYYVVIEGGKKGDPDDDRILDIKQQSKPTPYRFLSEQTQREYDEQFENNAHRHAVAYQALTRHTDDHLGWMCLDNGCYSVRERSPFKEAFPGEVLDTRTSFSELAEQWAEILATDHTRANKDLPNEVHDLIDDHEQTFLDLTRTVAFEYAEQVMTDWNHLVAALALEPGVCTHMPFRPPSYRDMLPR